MRACILVAVVLSLCVVSVAQQPSRNAIREVQQKSATVGAPRECLQAFREFFQYLQNSEPGIVRDEQAQKRWLTQELRTALAKKVATFSCPQEDPDFPSNSTFIGSWDYPSTYAIVSQYFREK
ncbi:MAG TPA: hypothetical protein VFR78_22055 [Pyrinomonadaceae bacterium]|nr:hypothetical protein [Pyrinomonadaceae bacterium]